MQPVRARYLLVLSAAATALLVSCGGGSGDAPSVAPPAPLPVGPDLTTAVGSGRSAVWPDQEVSYTVTVRNVGTAAATGGMLTVPAVSGVTYEAVTCAGSGGAVCPAASMAALAAGLALTEIPVAGLLTFRIDGVVTGPAGTMITATASASVAGDLLVANNASQVAVPVEVPPAATLVASVPPSTYPKGSDLEAAFNWINTERSRCGMGLLTQDERLDAAAQDHANYQAINVDNGNLKGLTHEQNPAYPGYTGVDGAARGHYRGYPGIAGDLDAATDTALRGFQSLFANATYHSLTAQTGLKDIGLGSMRTDRWNAQITVVNLAVPVIAAGPEDSIKAAQLPAGDAVVTYPCGGEILLARRHAPEIPTPLPDVDLLTRGPPITVVVRYPQRLLIKEFVLKTAAGESLTGTLLTAVERPGNLIPSKAAFIPDAVLPANTAFNVYIRGTNEGQRFEKRFSFSTGD